VDYINPCVTCSSYAAGINCEVLRRNRFSPNGRGIEVASAGLDKSSREQVTPALLEWADLIFVMERAHRNKLAKKFRGYLKHQRVICLNIPDEYPYMDPRLVRLFEKVVPPHLGTSDRPPAAHV
jgi:predicted protein tyrosine phosphatase